jgi:hypothetical protein
MQDLPFTPEQFKTALGHAAESYALTKDGQTLTTETCDAAGAVAALRNPQQHGQRR